MMPNLGYDKLKSLIYTEKSNKDLVLNKYSFEVDYACSKTEIKGLIEGIFSVKVKKLNIINVSGKVKRFKGRVGKRSCYKKALVTLEVGSSINIQDLK